MVPWWTIGGWWYKDVDDVEDSIISSDIDALLLNGVVSIEHNIGGEDAEGYGIVIGCFECADESLVFYMLPTNTFFFLQFGSKYGAAEVGPVVTELKKGAPRQGVITSSSRRTSPPTTEPPSGPGSGYRIGPEDYRPVIWC